MKRSWAAVAALALLGSGPVALADVAPPPDYVERCVLGNHQAAGLECQECSTNFSDPNKCATSLQPGGFQHRCRTSGASVWTEIWCRPVGSTPPPPTGTGSFASPPPTQPTASPPPQPTSTNVGSYPPPPPELRGNRGCGSCAVGTTPTSALVAGAVALALALVGGRRLRGRRSR